MDWLRLRPLLRELQDLKRQQPAHLDCSIATRLFRRAWADLIAGEEAGSVARRTTTEAVINILFPGCDEAFFLKSGLRQDEALDVLRQAFFVSMPAANPTFAGELPGLVARFYGSSSVTTGELPTALELLCRQPRAGATRPGFPRLLLVPPEMHSDHCLMTAVYATLLAEPYGADPGAVFVCALAHHLHNAYLPDCGFAGEICLGGHLGHVIATCRKRAASELPTDLRNRVLQDLTYHETISAPEGKAVSAGDVLDRVLDVKWRTRAAAVTDADILDDLDLVHAGPLKDFQVDLLTHAELHEFS